MVHELSVMMQRQHEFNRLLHKETYLPGRIDNQDFINYNCQALFVELAEALQETPWKVWKKGQVMDLGKFQEELVDCWHFLINLSLAAGFTPETLFKAFIAKNEINFRRQKEGY